MRSVFLFVVLAFASLTVAAPAEEAFKQTFSVTKLAGWFNTYSLPVEGTTWTLDLADLTAAKEHGRIDFTHADKDRGWYYPYHHAFRVVKQQTDDRGLRSLRLVSEDGKFRTVITVRRIDLDKQPTTWRGFFVFEEIDGEILGQFAFE